MISPEYNLNKLYKTQSMREILKSISKLHFENSCIYIYGEKGTEKDYIVAIILQKMHHCRIVRIPDETMKKHFFSENVVYIIKSFENIDLSFLNKKSYKCAIFVSDLDYENLYINGKINKELYEVLSKAHKLYIPPLRERKQDIIPLANFFLKEIADFLKLSQKKLFKDAQAALLDYSWNENAYQLKQCLAKAFILSKHQKLNKQELFGDFNDDLSIKNFLELKLGNLLKDFVNIENSNLYETVIQEVEKALFTLVLNETGGNQLKSAKILGINRNTLHKKLKTYNLILK